MKKTTILFTAIVSFNVAAAGELVPEESVTAPTKKASNQLPVRTQSLQHQKPTSSIGGFRLERKTPRAKIERAQAESVNVVTKKIAKQRQTATTQSARSSDFVIYDAWTYLDVDLDGDGYYSEFTVSFDVDVVAGYADIYADIYLSREGGPWEYLNSTDIFTIFENDADDYYSLTSRLNFGFPTGSYEVAIDVFENGYSDVVASADGYVFDSLYDLPLEDEQNENFLNPTEITYVATDLYDDYDYDGFYTRLFFEFDVDTIEPGRRVYTEFVLTRQSNYERFSLATQDFDVYTQTEVMELILDYGYQTGWYDAEIRIVDSYTGEVLESVSYDFYALEDLPLESADYDQTGHHDDVVVIVDDHGGGSLGWGVLLIALAGLLKRKRGLAIRMR